MFYLSKLITEVGTVQVVLDYVTSPDVTFWFMRMLEYDGRFEHISYVGKPEFKLLLRRYI